MTNRRIPRVLGQWRRFPLTISFVVVFLAIGLLAGTLTAPAHGHAWYPNVAFGIPSLEHGAWWTPVTAPFLSGHPPAYVVTTLLTIAGLGFAEWRLGAWRTLAVFLGGAVVGALGAAAFVAAAAPTGWVWAIERSRDLYVGPSVGTIAAVAFATATLPSPWRLRSRIAIGAWVITSFLYVGTLSDVERLFSASAALLVSGFVPAWRHPMGRPTAREWRLLALLGLVIIGAIEIIDALVPHDAPFGANPPDQQALDVTIDLLVIALVAWGIARGIRIAWIVAVVLASFNIAVLALGVSVLPFVELDADFELSDFVGGLVAPGVLWSAELGILLLGRSSFRVPWRLSKRLPGDRRITRETVVSTLREHGGGTISWMATWRGNLHTQVEDGVVAYQRHSGVAIALGDPIVSDDRMGAAVEAFAHHAQRAGLVPCFFSASRRVVEAMPAGWRANVIAEDTIVDLPGFTLAGKKWQPVRTSVNRADREGISFRMTRLADEPWGVLAQVRAISEQWSGDKGLPEMRFTLGTVEEARDPEVRVGLAFDAEGSLHGITSWLPVYGPDHEIHGWTLDLMRRREGGFGPVMEFLIGSSALRLSEEGYRFLSLSGAPLARSAGRVDESGPVDRLLDGLGGTLEPLYGFRSLHRFKQKFHPRYEPLHLVYRDEGDLPRIGLGLTRAYLPGASLGKLAALGASATAKE